MGNSSSVASFALKLAAPFCAVSLLFSSFAFAQDEEEPAAAEPTAKSTTKKQAKRYSRFEYDIGLVMWTEKVTMSGAGNSVPVDSSTTGVTVGADWRKGTANSGLIYQAGVSYGQLTSEGKSSVVVYQKGREQVIGVHGGAGFYFRIPASRAEIAILAQGRFRRVEHTVPAGYSFENDANIIAGFAEVDLSIPLSKSVTLFQQYSVPLHDKRLLSPWVIGVRL